MDLGRVGGGVMLVPESGLRGELPDLCDLCIWALGSAQPESHLVGTFAPAKILPKTGRNVLAWSLSGGITPTGSGCS